ncbi:MULTISPECIES: hypothetical protein [Enterococcus]|uniref:hypothetical protein n=1 Tax=Enterococcus TaxID=1350 RepID=UPI0034A47E03
MSVTSLSKLISTRKEELARLLEWRGTNFPVVERQNDLRISFIELELEDLEELNNQPQLNENQQQVLDWLKDYYKENRPFTTAFGAIRNIASKRWMFIKQNLTENQQEQVLQTFIQWVLEQEEE